MKKALTIVLALLVTLGVGSVFAGGSSEKSSSTSSTMSSSNANFFAGLVTDTGGIDDRSFNASAWQGVQNAMKDLGIKGQYLQSNNESDYTPNIQQFVQKNANIVVTVGFLMGDQTKAAAQANPNTKFAIVDFSYDPPVSNILGLTYQTDQAAFLAGYAAAGMSKTGKVGTFGGMNIPTVTIFMEGFAAGVRYYDQQKNAHVQVLGWDPDKKSGTFTNDFTNQAKGKTVTETLINQGADVVMPVAGSVGLGAAAAIEQHDQAGTGNFVYLIGVDTDWYVSAPQYKDILLTSVQKGIAVSVEAAIKEAVNGTFSGGNYVGTLKNDGVGMAPFHDMDSKVSSSMKSELDTIKKGIIDGSISVDPGKYSPAM